MIDFFYLKHRWKAFSRNPNAGHYVLVGFILGVLILIINKGVVNGWPELITVLKEKLNLGPNQSPLGLLLLMLLFSDLVGRIMLPKQVPNILHYHLHPVKQASLKINYLLSSIFSLWNIGVSLLQIGLVMKLVESSDPSILSFIVLGWLCNILLAQYIFSFVSTRVSSLVIAVVVLIQFVVFYFPSFFVGFYPEITIRLFLVALIAALTVLLYKNLDGFFRKCRIPKEQSDQSFLNNIDIFKDPLMQLEASMILRNKRARGTVLASLAMIPYFLLITDGKVTEPVLLFLMSILITGLFIFQMGTYVMAWEGSYFDLLMTRLSPKEFISHKYRFYLYSSLVFTVLFEITTLFIGLYSLVPLACFLYNVGWNIPLILNNGFKNTEKLDLSKGVFFNYQGFNGTMIVTSLVGMVLPIVIFFSLTTFLGQFYGQLAFFGFGVLGSLLKPYWIVSLSEKLGKKKYYLSTCYRS